MKNLTLLFAVVLLFTTSGFSQGCLPEGINLLSQEDIDNFQTNFPGCTEIEGSVYIRGVDITNLSGLIVLESVGGNLDISYCDSLISLNGLNQITSIKGQLNIFETGISSLEGLEGLDSISGSFYIALNNNLISAEGLDNLKFVGQEMYILQNPLLENFEGLNSLATVGGYLRFGDNNNLKSIRGFSNLSSVYGSLWIEFNPVLTDVSGFASIDSIGEQLKFTTNASLQDFSGMNVSTVGVGVSIYGNSSLLRLEGLNNLRSVGQDMVISKNDALLDLNALDNLVNIQVIGIVDNDNLLSLEGLNNIDTGSLSALFILFNPLLSICDAESVCEFISDPSNSASVNNNAPGCNNLAEIEAACQVGVPELSDTPAVSIYPNPASDFISISGIGLNNKICVTFFNQLGLITGKTELTSERVDVSNLEKGLYIAEIKSNSWVTRQKFIIN
jgi:hypothetical protein